MLTIRRGITVQGRVQGVGFRFFTYHCAIKHRLSGWVRNCIDSSVEMEVQGSDDEVALFTEEVRRGPILARVNKLTEIEMPVSDGEKGFAIRS